MRRYMSVYGKARLSHVQGECGRDSVWRGKVTEYCPESGKTDSLREGKRIKERCVLGYVKKTAE